MAVTPPNAMPFATPPCSRPAREVIRSCGSSRGRVEVVIVGSALRLHTMYKRICIAKQGRPGFCFPPTPRLCSHVDFPVRDAGLRAYLASLSPSLCTGPTTGPRTRRHDSPALDSPPRLTRRQHATRADRVQRGVRNGDGYLTSRPVAAARMAPAHSTYSSQWAVGSERRAHRKECSGTLAFAGHGSAAWSA